MRSKLVYGMEGAQKTAVSNTNCQNANKFRQQVEGQTQFTKPYWVLEKQSCQTISKSKIQSINCIKPHDGNISCANCVEDFHQDQKRDSRNSAISPILFAFFYENW